MVDSVQVAHVKLDGSVSSVLQLQQSDQWAARRREGLEEQQDSEIREFILCQLPFGYKSLFSSGKFSAVEYEGLNAIGFCRNKIKHVEIMCFPVLYTLTSSPVS